MPVPTARLAAATHRAAVTVCVDTIEVTRETAGVYDRETRTTPTTETAIHTGPGCITQTESGTPTIFGAQPATRSVPACKIPIGGTGDLIRPGDILTVTTVHEGGDQALQGVRYRVTHVEARTLQLLRTVRLEQVAPTNPAPVG